MIISLCHDLPTCLINSSCEIAFTAPESISRSLRSASASSGSGGGDEKVERRCAVRPARSSSVRRSASLCSSIKLVMTLSYEKYSSLSIFSERQSDGAPTSNVPEQCPRWPGPLCTIPSMQKGLPSSVTREPSSSDADECSLLYVFFSFL